MVRIDGLIIITAVTIHTYCGSPGISIGMAIHAIRRDVSACQRKIRQIVVKTVVAFTGRVALKAGIAVVNITTYFVMLVIHIRLVVLMAADARKFNIIV